MNKETDEGTSPATLPHQDTSTSACTLDPHPLSSGHLDEGTHRATVVIIIVVFVRSSNVGVFMDYGVLEDVATVVAHVNSKIVKARNGRFEDPDDCIITFALIQMSILPYYDFVGIWASIYRIVCIECNQW